MCLSAIGASAAESEIDMSYAQPGGEQKTWGTNKAENYDFAIRISDPGMAGTKITAFRCPVNKPEKLTNIRGWLSKELATNSDRANVPDVMEVEASVSENGMLSVVLTEPYVLTREGVYIGFSFDITELDEDNDNKKPLILVPGTESDGFWMHSSRTYRKWRKMEYLRQILPMTVTLMGDFADNSLAVTSVSPSTIEVGDNFNVTIGLSNFGTNEVRTIDYTYSVGDVVSGAGSLRLDTPVPATLGGRGTATIPIKPLDKPGNYPIDVTVTKVNGEDNMSSNATCTGSVVCALFVPVNRPLFEEYTGLWCGFCPRGYIGMERMKELYPDRFVALSYHGRQRDPLECTETTPNNVSGYPKAYINRELSLDPYYGSGASQEELGVRNDWLEYANRTTIAEVDAHLGWTDENHTAVNCYARVRFVGDYPDSDYRLSFALLADGITQVDGTELLQSNYFKGDYNVTGSDWDKFVYGEEKVNIPFNDIVVAYNDQWGVPGSLPTDIQAGEYYGYSYQYSLPLKNKYGVEVVSDYTKLRCVAVLTSSDGKVINCCASPYIGTSGIGNVIAGSASPIVSTEYYNLSGIRVEHPSGGIFIRIIRHEDGTSDTDKVRM